MDLQIKDNINKEINENDVCLFMKGTPDVPQCGFSLAVANVLKHLNVNLKAPAILTQDFKKYLKSNKGNIVNIIDQRIFKLTPYFFSYTLSKTGLQTLTKTSAMALSPNIRVNGIAPGPTIKNKRQSESHFKKQWKSLILKYKVDPKNICETDKYFIYNDNVTGQIISVDSGQSLAWKTPDIINNKE